MSKNYTTNSAKQTEPVPSQFPELNDLFKDLDGIKSSQVDSASNSEAYSASNSEAKPVPSQLVEPVPSQSITAQKIGNSEIETAQKIGNQYQVQGIQPKKPLSFEEYQVVDLFIEGKTEQLIGMELGLSTKYIKTILARPYIREYIDNIVESTQYAIKSNRIRLLNLIANAKIDEALESGLTYANLTKKDVVDIIREIDTLQKEKEKKELGTNQNNTYVNILQQVIKSD